MGLPYSTQTIKGIETFANREVLARLVVLAAFSAMAHRVLGIPAGVIWVWYAAYLFYLLFFFWIVSALPERLERRGTLLLALLAGLGTALFHLLTVWLWSQPSGLLKLVAFVLLAGAMLNALARREVDPLLRQVETLGVLAVLAYFPLQLWWVGDLHGALVLSLASPLLAVYFLDCMRTLKSRRVGLREVAEREMEMTHAAAMGRVAGGVAHDFNNMLTVILGNLELRREVHDPKEREDLILEAEEAARRAVTEIGYLMAYSRQSHLSPQPLRTDSFMEAVEAIARRVASPDITVGIEWPGGLPPLRADPVRLETMLTGVIVNACEAMQAGGILRLEAREVSIVDMPVRRSDGLLAPGNYLRIDVGDTGEGIAPDLLSRVTEPFFTTRPRGRHSGLGLSFAQGIAEQSGGALTIDSMRWRGTTVSVYLPVADQ